MKRKYKAKVADLENIVLAQGREGNWNMDGYMCGLFNGLEFALSIMQEREPKFRTLKIMRPNQSLKLTKRGRLAGGLYSLVCDKKGARQ